jgi:hypothetical protein
MKNQKGITIRSLLVLLGGLLLTRVTFAGSMQIENGTVFTENFTKDGRTVEMTKTFYTDKVVITQKIYDASSGELIREKTTENPLSGNVTIVNGGQTNNSEANQAPDNTPSNEVIPVKEQTTETTTLEIEGNTDFNNMLVELQKDLNPEEMLQKATRAGKLTRVTNSYVGTTDSHIMTLEGYRERKLLGIITVNTPLTVTIDTRSNLLVQEDRPFITKIVELVSF